MLVNNAAYQMSQDAGIAEITTEQLDRVFKTNVYAMFWLCKAAVPHMPSGSPEDKVASFGEQAPMGRAAQSAELAPVYVFLASQESSHITAETLGVAGGSPIT